MEILRTIARSAKRLLPRTVFDGVRRRYEAVSPRRALFLLPRRLGGHHQYPRQLTIALTTRCNLDCFVCKRERFGAEELDFDNLAKLEHAVRHASAINLTGVGESLIYPRFSEVLDFVYALNGSSDLVRIITNGTRLSEEIGARLAGHLNSLTVSLNAASRETYNRDMKGGDFDRTLDAVRAAMSQLSARDRAKVRLHFVAHTRNYLEIPDFVRLAADLDIRAVSVGQYLAHDRADVDKCLINVKDGYNRSVAEAFGLADRLGIGIDARRFDSEKPRSTRACLAPFRDCYIAVDGEVSPCCFSGIESMGNAYRTSFEDVWFGDRYRRLRRERYLSGCSTCAPFVPLDDIHAHLTSTLKERADPGAST